MLARLVELADRLHLPPPHYSPQTVRWRIELATTGRFLGFVETAQGEGRAAPWGRRAPRGLTLLVPYRRRTSAIKPSLLVGDGRYVFGWTGDAPKRSRTDSRVQAAHEAFVKLVEACYEATQEQAVGACLAFLRGEGRRMAPPAGWQPADLFTFSVEGRLAVELPAVQRFWANTAASEEEENGGAQGVCSVCGQAGRVVSRLPLPLRGIPGGPRGGTTLISANSPAFESYGLPASSGASLCPRCAERSHQALNALLGGEAGARLRVGQVVYVAWTRRPDGFDALRLLSDPRSEDVVALVRSVHTGRPGAAAISLSDYYALALTASQARAVVRYTLESTVETVAHHVASFFERQQLVDDQGRQPGRPLGVGVLAGSTVRQGDDPPAGLVVALTASALEGRRLPTWVLDLAVRRARLEQRVSYPRAVLIKLALLTKHGERDEGEETLMALDETNRDAPYVCGRLLAVLESLQRAAQPGIRQTLVDRFYGSASTAPASVFGTLLRQAQAHLSKLRRDNPPAFIALAERLEAVQSLLDGFPPTLTLQEQGRFALGYWHQRAADRAAARAHRLGHEETPTADEAAPSEGNGDPA